MTHSLLLASASPRRRQLIGMLGLDYVVGVTSTDEEEMERNYQGPLDGLAEWLAKHKVGAALKLPEAEGRIVIAADTTVLLDERILGKPRDRQHARALLRALRGRWHHVVTGIAVSGFIDGKRRMRSANCITPVLMREYSDEEIRSYIATGDPLDKAGAYGIQHPSFQPTECIDGCYLNVVGLPVCILVDLLAEFHVYPRKRGPNIEQGPCPWSERCQI